MGSMWCKPAEFRDDCSPKINIQSILARLRGQVCPSRCRYPQTSVRPRTKQRPRNISVSNGGRPVISPPLMQPVPPPRKKRRRLQDMSRSEEELSSSAVTVTPLRTANSLPVLCIPINQLRPDNEVQVLPSIREEPIYTPIKELEEMESIPISEVYFLRKEDKSPNFEAVSKDVADKGSPVEEKNEIDMANSNFLDRSVRPGQTKIKTEIIEKITNEKKQIVETETVVAKVVKKPPNNNAKRIEAYKIPEISKVSVSTISGNSVEIRTEEAKDETTENIYENVEVKTVQDTDNADGTNGKRWQDAVKSKWLQNILIGSDLSENQGVNSNTFVPNDLQHPDKKESSLIRSSQNETQLIRQQEMEPRLQNVLENTATEKQDKGSRQLIVTTEALTDTLERLNSPKLIRDALYNTRNLIYSSKNGKEALGTTIPEENDTSTENERNKTDNIKKDKLNPSSDNHHQQHSRKSSRRSSITDSLHEFESSIYDMLQESAKGNASDDEDSLVLLHKHNAAASLQEATTASS